MRKLRSAPWLAAATLVVAAAASAKPPARGQFQPPARTQGAPAQTGIGGQELLQRLHAINELEMRVGEMATRQGQSKKVQRYGRVLARDHRTADARLLALAQRLNLPIAPATPRAEEAKTLAKLQAAKGAAFDQAFLAAMHEGHQKVIGMLRSAGQSQNPAVRDLVGRMLPILRQHDQLALNLERPPQAAGGRHG